MSAGRKNNSPIKNWNTPPKIISAVKGFWGEIVLDPCSNEHSLVGAKKEIFWPQDGLAVDWPNKTFVNPPYGRNPENKTSLLDWVEKAANSQSEVIMLIPVATNTRHFYKIFDSASAICFLKDSRLKFWMEGKEDPKGAPMACCLAYWGDNREEFAQNFQNLGKVVMF